MSSTVHHRKRETVSEEATKARRAKEASKIKDYNDVVHQLQTQADAGVWTSETFSLTTRVLQQNPDYYTLWNVRRRCLMGMHANDSKAIPRTTFQSELQFFMLLTRINPKSYWLWNHRRWCLETMPEPDWAAELGLVEKLLAADARNFHGWDYRRYVVDQMRTGNHEKDVALVQGEYNFTTKKIKQSFSNFSAWHNRTRLLPEIVANMSPEEKNEVAKKEIQLVEAAIYTDPDDQSAWIYYRWVVGRVLGQVRCIGAYRADDHGRSVTMVLDKPAILYEPPTLLAKGKRVEATWVSLKDGLVWVGRPVQSDDPAGTPDKVRISNSMLVPQSPLIVRPTEDLVCGIQSISFAEAKQLEALIDASKPWVAPKQQLYTVDRDSYHGAWHTLNRVGLLKDQIRVVRELLELEPDSKWALQTLAHFMDLLRLSNAAEISDELPSIYDKLAELDPYRKRRYHDAKHHILLDQKLQTLKNTKQGLWDVIECTVLST